jgi:hypothetical protein
VTTPQPVAPAATAPVPAPEAPVGVVAIFDPSANAARAVIDRWPDVRTTSPTIVQTSMPSAVPTPIAPGAPVPAAPVPFHAPETPVAFEGGVASSSSAHGSSNVLMLAAILVTLFVLCGLEGRRAWRFISVAPRLDFAFAFERPG